MSSQLPAVYQPTLVKYLIVRSVWIEVLSLIAAVFLHYVTYAIEGNCIFNKFVMTKNESFYFHPRVIMIRYKSILVLVIRSATTIRRDFYFNLARH